MTDLGRLWVWRDPGLVRSLGWYAAVAANRGPAKFRITAGICTYPVLDWVAEHMPEVPINIMEQCRPDNFCNPRSAQHRPQYAEVARRPSAEELRKAYRRARALNLQFDTITFEKSAIRFAPAASTP